MKRRAVKRAEQQARHKQSEDEGEENRRAAARGGPKIVRAPAERLWRIAKLAANQTRKSHHKLARVNCSRQIYMPMKAAKATASRNVRTRFTRGARAAAEGNSLV